VTETTTREQIEIWKKELRIAMADEQWRLALKFCSWVRYVLSQQGLSDPEVEEAHRRAKESLAKQVVREKSQQRREERCQRLRRQTMYQIISGHWDQALDSVEALYQNGANRQEAIDLLQELKARLGTSRPSKHRRRGRRAAALSRRFDEFMERFGGGGT